MQRRENLNNKLSAAYKGDDMRGQEMDERQKNILEWSKRQKNAVEGSRTR